MLAVMLSPLSYLRIRHPDKRSSDWYYPIGLSIACCILLYFLGGKGSVAGKDGLLDKLLLVCSVLPGFYIAALAAIATFNKPDIDEVMPAPAPILREEIRGHENEIQLTRRRFLAHLFAFLCWESLLIMLVCVFAGLSATKVVDMAGAASPVLKMALAFLVLTAFWQMICATCLGLYYLGERLLRPTY